VTKSSTTVVADGEFRAHGWRRRRDLLLMRISLSASWKRNFPPLTSKATSVEPPCICRCTTSAWRVVRMLGDRDRRRGVGLLPLAHGQRFEPLEQDPGVERRERRAGLASQGADVVLDDLMPRMSRTSRWVFSGRLALLNKAALTALEFIFFGVHIGSLSTEAPTCL
jgi:hypothetical protein